MDWKLLLLILSTLVLVQGTPLGEIRSEIAEADRLGGVVMRERQGGSANVRNKVELMKRARRSPAAEDKQINSETKETQSNERDKREIDEEKMEPELKSSEDYYTRPNEPRQRGGRNTVETVQEDENREEDVESEYNSNKVAIKRRIIPYISSLRGPFKVTALQPAINNLKKTRKRCFCNFPSGRVHEFEVIGCEGPYTCGGCGDCGSPYPVVGLGCQPGCGGIGLWGGLGPFDLHGWGSFGGCGNCGVINGCGGIGGCGGCGGFGGCGGCGGCGGFGGCGGCGGCGGFGGCGGCGGCGGFGDCGGFGGCGGCGGSCGCGACGIPTVVEHVYHCCKKNTAPRRNRGNTQHNRSA